MGSAYLFTGIEALHGGYGGGIGELNGVQQLPPLAAELHIPRRTGWRRPEKGNRAGEQRNGGGEQGNGRRERGNEDATAGRFLRHGAAAIAMGRTRS
jgi:hypothetical protein